MSDLTTTISKLSKELQPKIKLWFEQDKNQETRNEILQLCKSQDLEELHNRFDTRIAFGTAGLRSSMCGGFSRMNTLTVLQATQGLATYVKENQKSHELVAVVGHDHRFHSSEFAKITATVFLLSGFKVHFLNPDDDTFVHTPLVPFTVKNLKASVGVMITASHNPKNDNGYKVYYSNGCQIIPPHDIGIAKTIDENLEPWKKSWDTESVLKEGLQNGKLLYSREIMLNEYISQLKSKIVDIETIALAKKNSKPWFVYTPMHGVGYDIFNEICEKVLFFKEGKDFIVVEEQRNPDPSFPTVSFPNPEEKGAIDMGVKLAEKNDIQFVIANDPDADRFSIAVKSKKKNNWHQMTGNEIGFLFAFYEFEKYKNNKLNFPLSKLAMVNSTVSSQMIKRLAEVEGFHYEDTLTGFKWIGNRALDLEKKGYTVPFGFEEAIGYMFPAMEADKDGICATVVFLQAYLSWTQLQKLTPTDIIENGFKKYGVFKEYNGYYILNDMSLTKKVFDFIRYEYTKSNEKYPTHIGKEFEVTVFRDLTVGFQSNTPNNIPNLPIDPSSQMITCELKLTGENDPQERVRFTIRGSGTEPKLKVYIESCSNNEERATHIAKLTWDVLRREWFRPEVTGLVTKF